MASPYNTPSPSPFAPRKALTKFYAPNGEIALAEFDCLRLAEAELTAILNPEN